MRADLHMHTTSSDGVLSPRELVRLAAGCGVTVMAITDHDILDGVDSLSGVETEIPVLVGTELSLRDMRRLHLLGYGLTDAPELRMTLRRLEDMRVHRAARMVEKLAALGMKLDYEQLRAQCQGTVGRMHLARALVAAGYAQTTSEVFDRWLGDDGPAYVSGDRLSMAEALQLMRRNGFVPVLAHPAQLEVDDVTLHALLQSWQKQGLMGVEVYHPSQGSRGYAQLDAMARRLGMLVTGGSDYHSDDGRHGQPGCTAPCWKQAHSDVEALLDAMKKAQKDIDG